MPSSALSLGLEDGIAFAARNPGERRLLGLIARAHSAVEVADIVAERTVEPGGIEDAVAYWSGFAHGVRRFLQDEAHAPG